MSILGNLFGGKKKPTLATISDLLPGGVKAIETRPMQECKQISAYVVFDQRTDAAVVYVDVPLAWIDDMKLTNLGIQTLFDEEALKQNTQADTPQVVTIGTTMYMNRYTSLRFLLISASNQATHITIPWPPDEFDKFSRKRPVLFVSLQDSSFHGNGNLDAGSREYLLKRYVRDIFP
jgi:hypothetical protein